MWAAEPQLEARKRLGFQVFIFPDRVRGAAVLHQEEGLARGALNRGKLVRRAPAGALHYPAETAEGAMTKSVLGIIGGSGIYDLPGLEKVRETAHREPVGRAVGGAAHRRDRRPAGGVPARATTRATGCRPPTSTIAPISTCSSAPASPISFRCRPAARSRRSCRPAPSCWSTSSSTAPTGAKARSSARAASPMCRWRIRCRRGCASSAGGGRGRRHHGRARRHLCVHGGAAILHAGREPDLQGSSAIR